MPESNQEPYPQMSGALPMSHHISSEHSPQLVSYWNLNFSSNFSDNLLFISTSVKLFMLGDKWYWIILLVGWLKDTLNINNERKKIQENLRGKKRQRNWSDLQKYYQQSKICKPSTVHTRPRIKKNLVLCTCSKSDYEIQKLDGICTYLSQTIHIGDNVNGKILNQSISWTCTNAEIKRRERGKKGFSPHKF